MARKHDRQTAGEKKRVSILATGGTIAGSAPSPTQPAYTSGQLPLAAMLEGVPDLGRVARIQGEQVANVGSQDMTFAIMIDLARRINARFRADATDGVVVTHGTDTMEETAYFLNLTVNSARPVVMTGAMRPFHAVSGDGPLNLFNAVAVAADPEAAGRGALVVMNERIHGAHSLTKGSTTSVETFISPLYGLIGTVDYGKTTYFRRPFRKHTHKSVFSVEEALLLPRVDIVYACADMPADLIDASVERGARGIVIAGDGNGNMNAATLARAARAVRQGVCIVRSSRVPTGKVGRNVEVDDERLGFIVSDELNPAKARILLMLALAQNQTLRQIQRLFYAY